MNSKLRSFSGMAWSEQLLHVRAFFLIAQMKLMVQCFGLFRTDRVLKRFLSICSPSRAPEAADAETIATVMAVVKRVASRHPCRSTCLTRSLVMWYLLRRKGIPTELCVGVRKDQEKLEGHAWLELSGLNITDSDQTDDRFAVIDRLGG